MSNEFQLEEQFYSKRILFSYSALNKLLYSPKLFYKHYILQDREESVEAHLVDGKLIHCLLLEEDKFHENFIIAMAKLPSENTRKVVNKVFSSLPKTDYYNTVNLIDLKDKVLEILKEINLHQKIKTDDDRLKKVIDEESSAYFNYLKLKGNRLVIDQETYDNCRRIADHIVNEPTIRLLLSEPEQENEKYLEFDTTWEYPFGLKGILDNFSIDKEKKIITINDVKKTSKTISSFKDTVEYYNYWLQAAIYRRLIQYRYGLGWTINFNFIVIDQYEQVYPFEVSQETLQLWDIRLKEVLAQAKYHYENRRYDLPYDFLVNKITL